MINHSGPIHTLVVHHSASASMTPADIQDEHVKVRGWSDVGYHYMIDSRGVLFLGRDATKQGAGVKGHNDRVLHVCVLGNFEKSAPKANQITTLKRLVSDLRKTHPGLVHLYGHQELAATLCPGKNLMPFVKELK